MFKKVDQDQKEKCRVACNYCRAKYTTLVSTDEVPFICNVCYTPNLRVIEREINLDKIRS